MKDKIKHNLTHWTFKDMIRATDKLHRLSLKGANKRKLYSHWA